MLHKVVVGNATCTVQVNPVERPEVFQEERFSREAPVDRKNNKKGVIAMLYKSSKILSIFLMLGLALVLAGCMPVTKPRQPPPPVAGIGLEITSSVCPSVVTKQGETVEWNNADRVEHVVRVQKADGSLVVDSGTLKPEGNFSFNFVELGEFEVICSSDGAMRGVITVVP